MRSVKSQKWAAVVALVLILIPLLGDAFTVSTLLTIFMFITLASAYNLLGGYGGYANFGYGAFYGLGAYVTGILANQLGVSPLFMVPVAGLIVGAFSAVIGIPLLRIRGVYFAISMITVTYIFSCLVLLFPEITKGGEGLILPPPPPLEITYYATLAVMFGTLLMAYKFVNSSLGIAVRSISQDEEASEVMGVDTARYKIIAFVLSIIPAAMIGGITAAYWSYIDPPTMFDIGFSIKVVLMARLGGQATIIGPIMGAIIVQLISYILRYTIMGVLHKVLWGALLALTILLIPSGVVEFLRKAQWLPISIRRKII